MKEDTRKRKADLLRQADERLREAIALLEEGVRNTNMQWMAERHVLAELRRWSSSPEEHTSLANLLRTLEEENDDPVWTRPLNSVKYPKR